MDMRQYIINNFKENTINDIEESINASIESKEEDPLLGLGVLFELMWKSSNVKEKTSILKNIKKELDKS